MSDISNGERGDICIGDLHHPCEPYSLPNASIPRTMETRSAIGGVHGERGACSAAQAGVDAWNGAVAKFWRLPRVEPAGGISASEPEVADDPERPCREVEASGQRRLQGPPLRSDADPAGRLVVPALSVQLP